MIAMLSIAIWIWSPLFNALFDLIERRGIRRLAFNIGLTVSIRSHPSKNL